MAAVPGHIVLSNGVQLPACGLGTYQAAGKGLHDCVIAALKAGLRHIDTAQMYKNEAIIAKAVSESGIPRRDVFITSKISPYQQGTSKARAACDSSLAALGEPLDCMLVHWPGASGLGVQDPANATLRLQTWRVLEEYYKAGRIRSIGVSNYMPRHLAELCKEAEVQPMVNQIELHPQLPQHATLEDCQQRNIAVVSYSTLGRGELLHHPKVLQVAKECQHTPAQVLLRWALQKGCAVIPKTVHVERIPQLLPDQLLQFELSDAQMSTLDGLQDGTKYCWDPTDVA